MRRTLPLLACIPLLFAIAQAQESKADRPLGGSAVVPSGCSKILVMNRDWDNAEKQTVDWLTGTQLNWWRKEGQKKFKQVCLVSRIEDADYVVMWAEKWSDYQGEMTVPKTITTEHSGTVNATSTNGTTASGTYRGTSTTTTYEKERFDYSIQRVAAAVYRTEGTLGQRQIAGSPIFTTNHKGQMRWSKPDKDALVDALKFVAKQTR